VLAFHISNRYLDLKLVLGNLAYDAGLSAMVQEALHPKAEDAALNRSLNHARVAQGGDRGRRQRQQAAVHRVVVGAGGRRGAEDSAGRE
jgi:transketolase C-terminal domain/subunit